MHKKMEDLTSLKNELIEDFKSKKDKVSLAEAGEMVDMIKDMAEAEEKCWKACYYKEIVCAMDDERGDMGGERMGYNPRRYASGRYAPAGRGHMGYTPQPHMYGPYMMDDRYDQWGYTPSGEGNRSQSGSRMGYPDGGQGGSSGNMDGSRSQGGRSGYTPMSRYGRSYDDYKESRRYYTETKDPEKKREMERHADEHIHESLASIKEIFREADPEMKTRFKNEMTKAINEMN